MVVDDKEKKPQEQKVAEQEPAPSALDIMTAQAMSLGAQAEEEQKAQDERVAQFAKNQEARQKAIAEGRSVYNAMFQKRKPEYDANKEKRLRNRAIVQSLGDILSAVASGAIAYGGRGQGYVPALPKDSALASLEDINKMRREYETANKEWEDLDLTYRLKAIEAEEEALKKMDIAEAEEVSQGAERVASKKKEAQQAYRDVLKTIHSEERAEKQRQFTASENAKNRSTRITRGGGNNPQEIEDEVALTFAELLYGGNIYGETERVSTTTGPNAYGQETTSTTTTRAPKTYNDLSALEKRTQIQKYKADKEIQKLLRVYNAAKEEGVTDNDAIEMAWEAYNESKK